MFNRIFWGIVLIGIGAFFILDQRGVITFDLGYLASTYWPLILVYFGLRGLFFQYKWGHGIGFGYLYPLLLTAIGVYFLGHNIDYIEMSAGDFFQYIIPFILIIVGIIIILRPGRERSRQQADRLSRQSVEGSDAQPYQDTGEAPNDHLSGQSFDVTASSSNSVLTSSDAHWHQERSDTGSSSHTYNREKTENHFSFIGDIHIGSVHYQLTPLNINHFIGDTVVDLTRAYIPDGLTKISIGSFIGDIKVLLPHDADVEASVTVTSFMGEYYVFGKRESGMFKNHREESAGYPFATKKIQLMVNTFIGDFRIERI